MKNTTKLAIAVLLFIANISIAQTTYQANVKVTKQEQNQWCWSACSKCILDYYGKSTTQCNIAEYTRSLDSNFGTTPCCTSPTGKCNNPNYLTGNSGIQGILKKFGAIASSSVNGSLTTAKLQTELGAKRPFVIFIQWSGGGGHFTVGCDYTSGVLTFMDPWQNNGMTTYKYSGGTAIKTNTGSGTWSQTLVMTTPYTPTGIVDEEQISEISVYPNPSDGALTVNSDRALKEIRVFNTTGQLVDHFVVNGDKSYALKIPAAGFYNVQIVADNGVTNKKVIVK